MSFDWASHKTTLIKELKEVTRKMLAETVDGKTSNWPKLLQERARLFQAFQNCDEHLEMTNHPDAEIWLRGLDEVQKLDVQIEDLLDFAKIATQNKISAAKPAPASVGQGLKLPLQFLQNNKKPRIN